MDKAAPRPSYGALELVDRQRRTSMMRCALIALSCVTAATLVVAIVALATATGSKDKHGPAPPAPPDTASMAYVASAVSLTVNPTVAAAVSGSDGLVLMVFFDVPGNLWAYHCDDYACGSGTTTQLAAATVTTELPQPVSVAVGGDGFVYASYGLTSLHVVHCLDVACTTSTHVDTKVAIEEYSSTMLISPATGLPLVFAGDRTDLDTLKSIACLNTDCSSSSTAALTTTAQPTQRPTAAVGPDGQVTLAWIGLYKDGEPLHVGTCADAKCASLSKSTRVPHTGNVTRPGVVFTGASAGPVISYFNSQASGAAANQMYLLPCTASACTVTAAVTTVDLGLLPSDAALGLLVRGLPVFVTLNANAETVVVAHCADTLCGTVSVVTDAALGAPAMGTCVPGMCASAFLGANGLPSCVFGGYDGLNLLRCSNEFCVPYVGAGGMTST